MIKVFLNSYGLIKLGFKSQSKITRKLVILDVYDGSQGRHPKRDLKPRFISPYPFKNPIILISFTYKIEHPISPMSNKSKDSC